ncbi:hypothetical protein JN10_1627 [Altererythrobacter ishigakiensis]|uniref:Uncharacterized protein n=1 Tax=Altererythrobacter ishigakiensis TaxID=476157 RepID=A0A562UWG5_9SPHN|nr:hypothetical protein JN10_1627 [Altererythrobacter ishigakiensis]
MRRTRLTWFALGAATSAIASIATSVAFSSGDKLQPYLSVSERVLTLEEIDQFEAIAQTSGALLRECGAKQFYMKDANGLDGVPFSLIKINKENDIAIHCVFERARVAGYPLHIQMISDQDAQTH